MKHTSSLFPEEWTSELELLIVPSATATGASSLYCHRLKLLDIHFIYTCTNILLNNINITYYPITLQLAVLYISRM